MWKSLWNGFARVATKAALWAASHPQVVIDIAQAALTKNAGSLENIPGDLSK